MSNTVKLPTCPKCHAPIPAAAPQGLCPRCVLLGAATATEAGVPATATSEIPSLDRIAAAFPQLEVLELIGRGGMGFVFKARQPHLDRFVALKLLPDKLAKDAQFAERFNREGRVLAKLNHPNITSVFDFGHASATSPAGGPSSQTPEPIPHPHPGFYYLLMEYVDGVNLRQAMRAGRFSPAEALALVPKVCEALQYAHEQGILHRDIKPENILLDTRGRVKIADFGIAKLVGEDLGNITLTNTGAALGTPHYMAPEQFEKPATVDHRADIYSLGVVFYEMLTGELPIGRFAAPSSKTPVNSTVDDVVFRTLEKDRERRFQSAGEMRTQVEHLGEGANAAAQASSIRTELEEQSYSRWSIYGAISVGLSLPVPFAAIVALISGRGGVGPAELWLALGSVALPGLGGTLLGWLGLNEIRESRGRVRGLPLAMFATLLWPLTIFGALTVGVPMFWAVPGGEPTTASTIGRFLVLLLPAAVTAFSIWASYSTARWAGQKEVVQQRGMLKWAFILVLLIGVGVVLVTNPGQQRASLQPPQPIMGGWAAESVESPAPLRANFRFAKGHVVTFEVMRRVGEDHYEPVPHFAGYAVAPDEERGRFSLMLTPEPSNSSTNPLRWTLRLISETGGAAVGSSVPLGELISMLPTNHWHQIDPDASFGLYLTRAYPGADTNGLTPLAELSLAVRSEPRNQTGFAPENTALNLGSTNWVPALRQQAKVKPARRAQPGEVLASQWLKSPAGTNSTNWIQFTFTNVELRNEDGQQWLAMGYLTDVHGDCEEVFAVDGHGFKAVTRKTGWRTTPAGSPPVEYSGIQWLVPPGIDSATLESFRKSVAEALVAKSFVIPEGEQRPLIRFPIGKAGVLSVGIGTKLRLTSPQKSMPASSALEFRLIADDTDSASPVDVLPERQRDGSEIKHRVLRTLMLDGSSVARADVETEPTGSVTIGVKLTQEGARQFGAVTTANTGRRMAIVSQGRVLSAPVIRSAITGGQVNISGSFSTDEASALVAALNRQPGEGTATNPASAELWSAKLAEIADKYEKPNFQEMNRLAAEGRFEEALRSIGPKLKNKMPPDEAGLLPPSPNAASAELWSPKLAVGEKPNVSEILQEAKRLTDAGRFEDALQRHIWYHNHALEFQPGQTGVRLSFALMYWGELAQRYPKAEEALNEIAERGTQAFADGKGDYSLFTEVSAIHQQLGRQKETLALFESIDSQDPKLARQCYGVVEDLLVEKGNYALCESFIPDFQKRFSTLRAEWQRTLQLSARNPVAAPESLRQHAQQTFIKDTRKLVEILVGVSRNTEAQAIRDQAVALLDVPELRSALTDAEQKVAGHSVVPAKP